MPVATKRWILLFIMTLVLTATGCGRSQSMNLPEVRAPELEPNLGWLNTTHPLRFSQELKGQVVLLDFWTYCCINCMHILPDLEYLEKKYADQPFVVIGVHSAKFENEADRETIRAAVQRYNIHHPVVIDNDMGIWNRYAARAWPTFVLIDSRGRVVGMAAGEGNREILDGAIGKALAQGRLDGTLAGAPLKLDRSGFVAQTGELAFPGKVLADAGSGRLFIADSTHNRIIVTGLPDLAGRAQLTSIIGSGQEGADDGAFATATFHNPQGMALRGDLLYIADTDNHLIREANLTTGQVRTIAGTGTQSYDRRGGERGTAQAIASPWALELTGNRLFIAMAGTHQIWVMDLESQVLKAFSGNGRENIVDGSATEANFAQPSGLAMLDGHLYVADSEVSGIRKVNAITGRVETVVGQGLFVFGDIDGRGDQVRLQHALGIAVWNDTLLLADTYNHKIKQLDPATRGVKSLFGTGRLGTATDDGRVAFFEPGGISVANEVAYVADTNNHRVVALHIPSGHWNEVMISGLKAPASVAVSQPKPAANQTSVILLDAATTITLSLDADLPSGGHPSPEAPMQVRVLSGENVVAQHTVKTDKLPVELELNAADLPTTAPVTVRWSFAWCREGNTAVCVPQRGLWDVKILRSPTGTSRIALRAAAAE